ncbi:hypothetical protein Bca4012_042041 [Brassica carinata]
MFASLVEIKAVGDIPTVSLKPEIVWLSLERDIPFTTSAKLQVAHTTFLWNHCSLAHSCWDSLQPSSLMMRQLHAVYGEKLLKDCRWDFVVDNVKGARIIFWGEGSTHAELLAMAQEDYNLDMST